MSHDISTDKLTPSVCVDIPCTCGELFQGALDGRPCLVSCPINIYSTAQTTGALTGACMSSRRKVSRALEWVTHRTGKTIGVEVKNSLPVGRGYGTSTADIGSTLFLASHLLGFGLTPGEASQAAVQIEPTDSTLFSGLTLFDHRGGGFEVSLGAAPSAKLIILDPGGMVDSETFNARDWHESLARLAQEQKDAFNILQHGVALGDLLAIGEASTLSARLHQSILFNPLIDTALSLSKQLGAAGICRAHSGTIVGLMFNVDYDSDAAGRFIAKAIPENVHIYHALLTGGGPIYRITSKDQEK